MNAPGPRLELRQGQSLVMTAQLQQSIKLLQLSTTELQEYLEQELEKNPLLSTEEPEPAPQENTDDAPEEGLADPADNAEAQDRGEERSLDMPEDSSGADDQQSPELGYAGSSDNRQAGQGSDQDFEQTVSVKPSLREHLLAQLTEIQEPSERMIAAHLIDMVDEAGYVKDNIMPLAEQFETTAEVVEAVLKKLQRLDPPGVCARNLSECLALQLEDKNRLDPVMQIFLQHLELIGKGDMAGLQKLCGVDADDIKDMLKEIRALNPKPGHLFPEETLQPVVPDVILKRSNGDNWLVELNPEALPRVLVNRHYFAELNTQSRSKDDKKYLSEQLATANWLTKALDQRAQTILKVSTEIVKTAGRIFPPGHQIPKAFNAERYRLAGRFT